MSYLRSLRLSTLFTTALFLSACSGGGDSGEEAAANVAVTTVSGQYSTRVRQTQLPSDDETCPAGGVLIEQGIDENGNGVLDDDEVDTVDKVCHGADGSDGTNGINGTSGSLPAETTQTQLAAGKLRVRLAGDATAIAAALNTSKPSLNASRPSLRAYTYQATGSLIASADSLSAAINAAEAIADGDIELQSDGSYLID